MSAEWMKVLVTQLCLTLCDPMDCSMPGSSVHGILQARILEWVAMAFSRGSSQPRGRTCISYISWIVRRVLYHWDSLVAQIVKHLPPVLETRVQSLGRENPLEKEMATHSSILAWEIPWTEEPGMLQSRGLQRIWHTWAGRHAIKN